MYKLQIFKHTDNNWYIGVFNSNGDFVKNLGGFSSLEYANTKIKISETTPAGEIIEVEAIPELEEVDLSAEENNTVESEVVLGTPNHPLEEIVPETITEEVVPAEVVENQEVEISEDGNTATFEDGSTAPITTREELVEKLREEEVQKIEDENNSIISEEDIKQL